MSHKVDLNGIYTARDGLRFIAHLDEKVMHQKHQEPFWTENLQRIVNLLLHGNLVSRVVQLGDRNASMLDGNPSSVPEKITVANLAVPEEKDSLLPVRTGEGHYRAMEGEHYKTTIYEVRLKDAMLGTPGVLSMDNYDALLRLYVMK